MMETAPEPRLRRTAQWLYLVPVLGAPFAHFLVTGAAARPQSKRLMLSLAAAATVFAVGNRLWLMADAGYPGGEGEKSSGRFS
jgi:hypothetical protein